MITIPMNSEAGAALRQMCDMRSTYKVSVEIRAEGVALKRNENVWTATLSTKEDA